MTLRKRDDIVIKPADKGGAIVVWRKDLYVEEVNKQLNNSEFYVKTTSDATPQNAAKVKHVIQDEIQKENLPASAIHVLIDKPICSQFYVVPKVHKLGNPGRPIVSACSCPTERVSALVDDILRPLVTCLPSYTRDSSSAIQKIKQHTLIKGEKPILFTMDVKSLYSIIPHDDGLVALKHFLDRRSVLDPPSSTVLRLAELVLTLNDFQFDQEYYRQVKGVAMGTRMGPSYANLFLGHLEEILETTYNGPKPEHYQRYIDDIFGITQMGEEYLQEWITTMCKMHPAVDFTFEVSTTSVDFLDAHISTTSTGITTSVHYKPTDSHNFLRYNSFHPRNTKDAIPFSQLLRLRRLTTSDSDFAASATEMLDFFRDRDYPQPVLKRAESRVKAITQEKALEGKPTKSTQLKIPFVTTYHPKVKHVFKVLKDTWNILTDDVEVGGLFQEGILLSQRKNKSLKDLLVHTKLSVEEEIGGTFRCGRSRCLTCAYTNSCGTVSAPSSTWNIKTTFQCTTANVVYAITCSACGMVYVGETKRRLADRFREHRRDVINHNRKSPVAIHFNLPNHSEEDMLVGGLVECYNDQQRKTTEMKLIKKLGTLDPLGMNFDFTYNV